MILLNKVVEEDRQTELDARQFLKDLLDELEKELESFEDSTKSGIGNNKQKISKKDKEDSKKDKKIPVNPKVSDDVKSKVLKKKDVSVSWSQKESQVKRKKIEEVQQNRKLICP